MNCATDSCAQGRKPCPTPDACHSDERARALKRFHAITEAEDEPPTRAEAVAWLFGELVAAVVCIGFVAGLANLIWVNRHWLKSVISSYFS